MFPFQLYIGPERFHVFGEAVLQGQLGTLGL